MDVVSAHSLPNFQDPLAVHEVRFISSYHLLQFLRRGHVCLALLFDADTFALHVASLSAFLSNVLPFLRANISDPRVDVAILFVLVSRSVSTVIIIMETLVMCAPVHALSSCVQMA